ncbi:IS66 family insertion sequence element accessory protein TnpA [methanotrophic endosymbiont of Bathymodiolus puteoserpentis (Logatchev)]|uniref:IS66 family insertion sequence element accessory protein TnpA n=1 Tax=methanotrophic endosymbiont of Bathymodiolus puteoserpentis (Logatchev) TaxID=343235 RepID=UPI0013C7CA79|nr:hypothetical protein [methanotrophic endosymbiont of Bathymodiolus puteoserpentis (Logatchev)]SHE23720.1 hypothetical protein BPUTEOMOX_1764 [methanotrophic endosymbiont of Bathymodiolus puteoserpentis (Logatchev)]
MHQYQDHTLIQEHIANWKASGLTQVAYCQQHAIKPHIFSYYKKKFSAAPAAAKKDKLMPDKLMPVKLIPEGVATLSTSPVVPLIKISHANGFSLEISLNSEMSSLKPVLELVGSIAC